MRFKFVDARTDPTHCCKRTSWKDANRRPTRIHVHDRPVVIIPAATAPRVHASMGLIDSLPADVTPVENRRITADTNVSTSCDQKDNHPMFLSAVPNFNISFCSTVMLPAATGDAATTTELWAAPPTLRGDPLDPFFP